MLITALQATDQELRAPLLARPIAPTVDRASNPYTFYYRLKSHDYILHEVKKSCFTRTEFFIDNNPVTKREYEAALLNQEYAAIIKELEFMSIHKINSPDIKLSLLLSKDINARKLKIKLFNEAQPSCCPIF